MGISSSNPDLFRAILAMDAYNRGYNAGIGDPNTGLTGNAIGLATIQRDIDLPVGSQVASFFAQAYALGGQTVISYRGTDAAWEAASGRVSGGNRAEQPMSQLPLFPHTPFVV